MFKKLAEFFRKKFVRGFIILTLLFAMLILSIMLVNLSYTVEHLAKSVITRTTNRAKIELDSYFDDAIESTLITKDMVKQGLIMPSGDFGMNRHVMPIFRNINNITTLAIASEKGNEFSLIREDSTWLNNFVYQGNSGMNIISERWIENDSRKIVKKTWEASNIDYDPRTRPWFTGAMTAPTPDTPFWTDPYVFFTQQQPGITVSMRVGDTTGLSGIVVQYDIMLTDISRFTTSQKISQNGKSFILSKDLEYIGLPTDTVYQAMDSIKKYILKPVDSIHSPLMERFYQKWVKMEKPTGQPFQFSAQGTKWWGSLQKYDLGHDNYFLIGVVVPERDFLTEIKKSRNIIIAGFTLVLIFIVIVVRSYQIKKKANILLANKNEQIEAQKNEIAKQRDLVFQQKQEITDSITYAKQIQSAVLPQPDYLCQCLSEYFILFKPRDIVSGDYFWIKTLGDEVIIVAADCTGHGVPGAFMSMLGISFLNEIVSKSDKLGPADILGKLREKVIISLNQKQEGITIKDGMDASLCMLNTKTMKLRFSGANNPLYLVREKKDDKLKPKLGKEIEDQTHELVEIKGDKMPVGIHPTRTGEPFTEHVYQLKKGDTFYCFSDGYADQFGGPKNKKFMYKPFKKLILETREETLYHQKEILEKTIEQWKKDVSQMDDILVIGVRV